MSFLDLFKSGFFSPGGLALVGNPYGFSNPNAADDPGRNVSRIFGRCWVKPRLLFARRSTHAWSGGAYTVNHSVGPYPGDAVDCIFALGQAGLTIRGVRVNGKVAGLNKNADGTWSAVGDDPYFALLCVLSAYNEHTTQVLGGYNYAWDFAPMQVLNGTSSPWGKQTNGQSSVVSGGTPPTVVAPAWTDITGSSFPAWAHLVGTEAEGLAYAQLTTLRCEGVPRSGGKIPDFEVLVDGIGGVDCSPVDAVRDILITQMGIPSGKVETAHGPDGATASSFAAWCAAMASTIKINAAIDSDPATQLEDLLRISCAEIVPTADGGVRVQPLGDAPVPDNGSGYVPATTAYEVDSNDIVGDEVEVEERPSSECPNIITVSYTDPASPDTEHKVSYRDDFDIAATQPRRGGNISSKFICSPGHARFIAEHAVRRSLRNRKSWRLELTARFLCLEQGDLLEIHDARLPVNTVRVVKRDLDASKWVIPVECEEWNGATHPIDITPDVPQGLTVSAPSDTEQAAIATGLAAAAQVGGDNLLRNSSFEGATHAATHGTFPDGWGEYNNGGEACTYDLSPGGVDGGEYARCTWVTANSDTRGWRTDAAFSVGGKSAGVIGGWHANQWYTVSFWGHSGGSSTTGWILTLQWNSAPDDVEIVAAPALANGWQQYVYKIRWRGTTPEGNGRLYISINGGVANGWLGLDRVQVQEGERLTSYTPSTKEAQDTADIAITNAGKKITYGASPPGSPSVDDLWFSSDTTTNCPDANCKGHTVDGSGVVQVGTYPHRKLYWGHRWNGSAWVDATGAAQIVAAECDIGQLSAITADLGTVTAGVLGVTSAIYFGSKQLSTFMLMEIEAHVYKSGGGSIYAASHLGVTGAARYDRGAGATPRYVVRVSIDSGLGVGSTSRWQVTSNGNGLSAPLLAQNVTTGFDGTFIDVGIATAAGVWQDPNSLSAFDFTLVVFTPASAY